MKKITAVLACILLSANISWAGYEVVIDGNSLPTPAKELIRKYFGNSDIRCAKTDNNGSDKCYEVFLKSGEIIEFDKNGRWFTVMTQKSVVPNGIVPDKIVEYIKSEYHGAPIKTIDRYDGVYDVTLSNDVELKFDGEFEVLSVIDY